MICNVHQVSLCVTTAIFAWFWFAKLLWKMFLWQISSRGIYTDLFSLFSVRLQHSTALQLQASGHLKFLLKQKHRAVCLFDLQPQMDSWMQHSHIGAMFVQMGAMQFCLLFCFTKQLEPGLINAWQNSMPYIWQTNFWTKPNSSLRPIPLTERFWVWKICQHVFCCVH